MSRESAQPFKRGARGASPVLDAMQKGSSLHDAGKPAKGPSSAPAPAPAGRAPRAPRQRRTPRTTR